MVIRFTILEYNERVEDDNKDCKTDFDMLTSTFILIREKQTLFVKIWFDVKKGFQSLIQTLPYLSDGGFYNMATMLSRGDNCSRCFLPI